MLLESKNIRLRFVEETDAEFILKLRLDERYNKYLSSVTADLQSQKDWIQEYKKEEQARKQFYFIIERLDGIPCGTFRIYDLKEDYFTVGSWILNEDKTKYAVIESSLLACRFGFEELGYEICRFDVRKDNKKTLAFHRGIGSVNIGEDEINYYFELNKSAFNSLYERGLGMVK